MLIPARLACDFCTNVIEEGTHYATLKLPIPPSLRREMLAFAEEHMMPRLQHSPISVIMGGVEHMIPQTWKLAVCVDCAYGILPTLRDTVTTQIRESIASAIKVKRRAAESLADLEEQDEAS